MFVATSVAVSLDFNVNPPAAAIEQSSQSCQKAISIYAMQKTGSTFLGRFSREITLHRKMCRSYQITKEFQCQTTVYIDCPRNKKHRKTVSLKQTFSTQLPESSRGPRCNSQLRREMFRLGNDWLRSKEWSVPYRYNKSVDWLLSEEGFSRGPLRQLYVEHADNAVPVFPGYHNVVIVHTRHPVEMMVSAFHCIANPSVCPVRSKFLGPHVPINDTISSVDDFVLAGLRRPGSTPYAILQRNEHIADFMTGFGQMPLIKAGQAHGCAMPTLLHSKYEHMVTNFSTWAKSILDVFIEGKGQRRTLLATLVAQYRNDFVPDGKHKHTLVAGSNMAKLKAHTLAQLMRNEQLKQLLRRLGYSWLGHEKRVLVA